MTDRNKTILESPNQGSDTNETQSNSEDLIIKTYMMYGLQKAATEIGIPQSDIQAIVDQYNLKRPAYKVPAILKGVRSGKLKEEQYPTLDFSMLYKIKPRNIKEFLKEAISYDKQFEDLFWMLDHQVRFQSLQFVEDEKKWFRTYKRLEPHAEPVINRLISEYNRL